MIPGSIFRQTLFANLIVFFSIFLFSTPALADDDSKDENASTITTITKSKNVNRYRLNNHFLKKKAHRKSSQQFKKAPVLDSRFPNSYRAYGDYLKYQEQKYQNHKFKKKKHRKR